MCPPPTTLRYGDFVRAQHGRHQSGLGLDAGVSIAAPAASCSVLKILFSILQRTNNGKYSALDIVDNLI
jgi:hypothetical protein